MQGSNADVAFSTTFMLAQVQTTAFDDYDSGSFDTPGPAGRLALTPPTDPAYPVFVAFSGSYNDPASRDADFPLGTYGFTLNNAVTGATEAVTASRTGDYSPIAPRLANFSALAAIDPGQPFTFRLAAGLPLATPGGAAVFSVFDTATNLGFTDQGVGSADHVDVAAGTFQRGHHYIYDILFVSEALHVDPATGIYASEDSFVFTRGSFTLATIPEPRTWALLVTGFGAVGAAQRRRRRLPT